MESKIRDYAEWLSYWADVQPEKPCLIYGSLCLTYAEMNEKAETYAQKFLPFATRQTVLIIKKTPPEQAIAFLGAEKAGWIPVLGHPDLSQKLAEELAKVRQIGWLDTDTLQPISPESPLPAEDICMGVLSSGSTGLPKLMLRTYASWGNFFPEQNAMFQVDRNTVAFGEGSLSFTGNSNLWTSIIYAGACMVFGKGLHPRTWLRDLKTWQINVIYLVPVKLKLFLDVTREAFPAVRTVLAGSQLLEESTARNLKQWFPNSQIVLYYGASEVDYITWLTYEELLQHPQSVGRPCPGVKVFVRDGLIYIDTPYHVSGLSCPCTLGDRGYFDQDGYLIFLGRDSQSINKGGLTINCSRIEQAIQKVPGVADAAVVPINDSKRGEVLGACVVLTENISLNAVRQFLKRELLPAEIPNHWIIVKALPLNGAGKVDYKKIHNFLKRK